MKKKEPLDPKRIQILTQLTNNLWVCLANLRENKGHDDSLPYQADIYVMDRKASPDKKIRFTKVGSIWNDGWGGDSNLETISADYIQKLRDEVAKHQMYYKGKPFGEYDLETLCDEMACIWVDYTKEHPDESDYSYVYLMDDNPLIRAAYNGSQILRFTTRKFAYEG